VQSHDQDIKEPIGIGRVARNAVNVPGEACLVAALDVAPRGTEFVVVDEALKLSQPVEVREPAIADARGDQR
jgi:hypothetical protein